MSSGVVQIPHSDKTILSQPINSIKFQSKRKSGGLSVRKSSSKYIAEQRTKARQIVLCLQQKNIKLVAIDFDNTLVSIHTTGFYQGTVENLLEHVRSTFLYFIKEILDSPSFNHTLHLCIVSFSSQEQLIRKLLESAFKTP